MSLLVSWPVSWSTRAAAGTAPDRVHVDVTDPERIDDAQHAVRGLVRDAARLVDLDRPSAQVYRLLRAGGEPVSVSPLLARLVTVALDAAGATGGLLDPTVGAAVLGLDRRRHRPGEHGAARTGALPTCGRLGAHRSRPTTGPGAIRVDGRRLSAPAGTVLDLRATTDAVVADIAARVVARRLGIGAVVGVGGDVAQAGPAPAGGWRVALPDGAMLRLPAGRAVSTVRPGRGHRVIDPRTGAPAPDVWAAVSVVHPRLVTAKALAVAAAVLGPDAAEYLTGHGAAYRLVAADGAVVAAPPWPRDLHPVPTPRRRPIAS
jgi:thiamine biosynthesis lipoprotein